MDQDGYQKFRIRNWAECPNYVVVRDGVVHVLLTMPHRGRAVYRYFVTQGGGHTTEGIREQLLCIEGIRDVLVDLTWNPPWTIARCTDAGRRAMGL